MGDKCEQSHLKKLYKTDACWNLRYREKSSWVRGSVIFINDFGQISFTYGPSVLIHSLRNPILFYHQSSVTVCILHELFNEITLKLLGQKQ